MLARSATGSGAGAQTRASSVAADSLLPKQADPDQVVDEILLLLGDERFPTARRMAAEALTRFPEHARVRQAWEIFDNHGKSKASSKELQPSAGEEFKWFKNPPEWAYGKWVALIGAEAVGVADSLEELMVELRSKNLPREPLTVQVHDAEEPVDF